jgi:hypothetical protein
VARDSVGGSRLQHATSKFSESDGGRLCLHQIMYLLGRTTSKQMTTSKQPPLGLVRGRQVKTHVAFTPPPKWRSEVDSHRRFIIDSPLEDDEKLMMLTAKSDSLREMQVNWHEFSCRSNKCRRPREASAKLLALTIK